MIVPIVLFYYLVFGMIQFFAVLCIVYFALAITAWPIRRFAKGILGIMRKGTHSRT